MSRLKIYIDQEIEDKIEILAVPKDSFTIRPPEPPELTMWVKVLFLDAGNNFNTATHTRGRIGTYLRVSATGRRYHCTNGDGIEDTHNRIAIINHTVQQQETVIILRRRGEYDWGGNEARKDIHSGHVGLVQRVIGSDPARAYLIVRCQTCDRNQDVEVSHWARPKASLLPAGAAEEIPELPEYWERRVRTIAMQKATKHRWCERLEPILEEIFAPNKRWRVAKDEDNLNPYPWQIKDPKGVTVAEFASKVDADQYLNWKTSQKGS